MKTLLVYRHGEARKNTQVEIDGVWEDVVGGRASNSPLTKAGTEKHAVGIGNRLWYLREQGIIQPETVRLIASTALRARHSLRIAAGVAKLQSIKPVLDAELEEFDQGGWTNYPKSQPLVLRDGGTARYVPIHERSLDYAVGGTETLRDATNRTLRALHRAAEIVPEGGVGVIGGHGITTRLAVIALVGTNLLEGKMDFGAETSFVIDRNNWSVPYMGLPTHEPNLPLSQALWQA